MDKLANIHRYLFISPRDRQWGLCVEGVGTRWIEPLSENYFTDPEAKYTWKDGRVLPTFAMVYIDSGKGVFCSQNLKTTVVEAGDILLLFPDIWHKYQPLVKTGWREYWVLFNGHYPEYLMQQSVLNPEKPVLYTHNSSIKEAFESLLKNTEEWHKCPNPVIASIVFQILVMAIQDCQGIMLTGKKNTPVIDNARMEINKKWDKHIAFTDLAEEYQMSYRQFSRLFTEAFGVSPQQYQQQIRVNKAKEILEQSSMPIQSIARQTGFDDPLYFSRLFRKKTGFSPRQWRKHLDRKTF